MPLRSKEAQRNYQRQWIAGRRAEFFADKACVDCGSIEELQLDHLDKAAKVDHKIWSWSPPRRDAEIAKCVVRCGPCHRARHAAERRVPHGASGYKRGCRCEVCAEWKRESRVPVGERRGRNSNPGTRLCRPLPNRSATAPEGATYQEGVRMDRVLMAVRNGDESEPVVLELDDPKVVVLALDDGQRLEFDRVEMAAALVELAA